MPSRLKSDWIDWRKAEAREIILDDLRSGKLPLTEEELPTWEAWESYQGMPEFGHVVYSQFEARLKDHRKQVSRSLGSATLQQQAYEHDRQLHPPQTHNQHGKRNFNMSSAKPLLVEDVQNELHESMTVEELWLSREEYQEWEIGVFRRRLSQQIRASKFLYYLEYKRAKKALKRGKKSQYSENDSEEEDDNQANQGAEQADSA
jgi:hypothetical protein